MIAVNSPARQVDVDPVEGADLRLALAVHLVQVDDAGGGSARGGRRGASAVRGVAVISGSRLMVDSVLLKGRDATAATHSGSTLSPP